MTRSYGAFHSGVQVFWLMRNILLFFLCWVSRGSEEIQVISQVYGREWSFGMTLDDVSTGVTWNPPGKNEDHSFRETISMGASVRTDWDKDCVVRCVWEWG